MKHLSVFFLLSILCTTLHAQINMQDSTVQVISYWDLGDYCEYDCILHNYNIQDGDTLPGQLFKLRYRIEVVDSTANSYTLEFRELSGYYEFADTLMQQLYGHMRQSVAHLPNLRILTDEYGTFQDIANWDEIQTGMQTTFGNLHEEFKNTFMQSMGVDKLNAEMRDSIMPMVENMIQFYLQAYSNKERYMQGAAYLFDLFAFNGKEYSLTKHYTTNAKALLPIEGAQPIDTQYDLFVFDYDTETSAVNFAINQHYDSDQLQDESRRFMAKLLNKQELPPAMPDEKPYIFIENYTNYSIHTDSGWMLWMYHKHTVTQGTMQGVYMWQVDLVPEDKETGHSQD